MKHLVHMYNQPAINRLFVVGDIHGCYDLLMVELVKVRFDFQHDWLVSVGDLIDRGSQCVQCVDLLKRPWFKVVRGNHEQMCMDGFADAVYALRHSDEINGGKWFYQLAREQRAEIVQQFKKLPIIIEITFKEKKYGFVHAQVDDSNDWQQFKQDVLQDEEPSFGRTAADLAIWGRERARAPLSERRFSTVAHVDAVYMGHTVLDVPTQKHNCFFIDTGAFMTSVLTLVEL